MSDHVVPDEPELERRAVEHFRAHLGAWPPSAALEIVGSERRTAAEWDGIVRPVLGIATAEGTLVSVPPAAVVACAALASSGIEHLSAEIGAIFGRAGTPLGGGTFRYLTRLVDLEPLGEWVEPDDRRIPAWLRPFNGGILIACDERGHYMAGVGLKLHDEIASEVAVGTEPEYRGRGLARRLVVTAARKLALSGRTATYEHAIDNAASASVASASGFEDRGWRAVHLGAEE